MKLIIVTLLGRTLNGEYVYRFYFSNNDIKTDCDIFRIPIGLTNFTFEDESCIPKQLTTEIKFDLIQDSMCHNFKHAIDGCVSISYENIDTYESYPEDGRLVFHYGMTIDEVEELLAKKNLVFD